MKNNKGNVSATITMIVGIVFMLYIASLVASTVYRAQTGGGNCYVNATGIYNCSSLTVQQYQWLNTTDVNSGTTFNIMSMVPIVLVAGVLIGSLLVAFMNR